MSFSKDTHFPKKIAKLGSLDQKHREDIFPKPCERLVTLEGLALLVSPNRLAASISL